MTEKFKQTDIGLIPEDWEVESLKNIQSERIPTINPANFESEEFEYYSIPAYQSGEIPLIEKGSNIQSNKLLLKEGSVLFGKLNPRVEKVWQVKSHTQLRKIGSTEWIPILPKNNTDFHYLYYLEWSEYIMPKAKQLVSGSTPSRQRVDPTSFYKLKVPLPPLQEQKRIAHVLSKIQQAIETQDQIIKTTQELKKALMQKLFTEGLNGEPQKQTEIGLIPKSWEVVPFSTIAEFKNGINFNKEQKGDSGILTIDVLNMYGKSYRVEFDKLYRVNKNIDANYLLKEGDLLFVRSSLKLEGVGWSSLFIGNSEPTTFCGFIIRARISNPNINTKYLTYFFRTDIARSRLISKSAKLGITNINQGNLGNVYVPLPSLIEQAAMVRILLLVDKKLEFLANNKKSYQELFKNMLNQLMTGQIRAKEIEFKLEKMDYS